MLLPERTPSLQHRLQRALLVEHDTASGIRYYAPRDYARQLLAIHGVAVPDVSLAQRRLAMEAVFWTYEDELEYFEIGQLRRGPGYAEALVSDLHACERNGLTPNDLLDFPDQPRIRDLGRLWRRVDDSLGWTRKDAEDPLSGSAIHPGRTLKAVLDRNLSVPASLRPVVAVSDEPAGLEESFYEYLDESVRFHRFHLTTPLNDDSPPESTSPEDSPRRLDNLQRHLFRSSSYFDVESDGGDDSVRFEDYSTPERELEAAVNWCLNCLEEGVPADRLGLVVAKNEWKGSLAGYVQNALDHLGNDSPDSLAYVESGIPLVESARGPNLVLLVKTLRHFLRQDEMLQLLPLLQLGDDQVTLSAPEWREMIHESGMLGGSRARPADARRWRDDFRTKIRQLEEKLSSLEDSDAEDRREPHAPSKLRRWKQALETMREPVDRLVEFTRQLHESRPREEQWDLRSCWEELHGFARDYLDLEHLGLDYLESVEEAIDQVMPRSGVDSIRGTRCLELLHGVIRSVLVPSHQNRPDGLFIGTINEAKYRSFEAVRVLGLTENTLPSVPREDPILPDHLRQAINEQELEAPVKGLDLSRHTARRRLHYFSHMIRSVRDQVVFTTSRKDRQGTKRTFSSLFVDLSLASGMTVESGEEFTVPGESFLHREMEQGRDRQIRRDPPLRAHRQVEQNGSGLFVPHDWSPGTAHHRDLQRIQALMDEEDDLSVFGVLDGRLPDDLPDELFNGLTEDNPLSASAARRFMTCPHWFMFDRLLGWEEPSSAPPAFRLSALHFGSLLHRAAESLYRQVQEEELDPGTARERLETVADQEFDTMMQEYTLIGETAETRERERLQEALANLLELDSPRVFSRSLRLEEHARGRHDGLHLHGYLDRVEDDSSGRHYVRDLKSGRARTDEDILPDPDVQLGLYQQILESREPGSVEEVSYLYPVTPWEPRRSFSRRPRGSNHFSLKDLQGRTDDWLSMVRNLLEERDFPRTEDEEDCRYCPYQPVCGARAQTRSEETLKRTEPPWVDAFLSRKGEES